MQRKITENLVRWKNKPFGCMPLLVYGARQAMASDLRSLPFSPLGVSGNEYRTVPVMRIPQNLGVLRHNHRRKRLNNGAMSDKLAVHCTILFCGY